MRSAHTHEHVVILNMKKTFKLTYSLSISLTPLYIYLILDASNCYNNCVTPCIITHANSQTQFYQLIVSYHQFCTELTKPRTKTCISSCLNPRQSNLELFYFGKTYVIIDETLHFKNKPLLDRILKCMNLKFSINISN